MQLLGPLRHSRLPSPDPQPGAPSSPIRSSLQVQQSSVNLMHSAGGGDRRQPAGHRRAGAGPASSPAAGPGRREAGSAGPEPSAPLRARRCRRAALPRPAWGHRHRARRRLRSAEGRAGAGLQAAAGAGRVRRGRLELPLRGSASGISTPLRDKPAPRRLTRGLRALRVGTVTARLRPSPQ